MYQFTQGSLIGLWGDLETSEELLRSAIARFRELDPARWPGGWGDSAHARLKCCDW